MILAGEDNLMFWTTESEGRDLCVMDSIGRFTLINEDYIDDVMEMLRRMKGRETHSVHSINPKDYVAPDETFL